MSRFALMAFPILAAVYNVYAMTLFTVASWEWLVGLLLTIVMLGVFFARFFIAFPTKRPRRRSAEGKNH